MTFYVTTSIPYVNAAPHLGHALELVQADLLARHRRARGEATRLQSGTDDNSSKNVRAAQAAGESVHSFVRRHADIFERLAPTLDLSYDDFVRTSSDTRHLPAVHRLWRAVMRNGDLYRRRYEGLYCVGCEDFYTPEGLVDGRCPEHDEPVTTVSEQNWFFRLDKYADRLRELYRDGTIRILPEQRQNEVLAFVEGGLQDFSVSRSVRRAGGWGVPVPGDPGQVMYVWWDALVNYLTGLGYRDAADHEYARWWLHGDSRVHVIGKGILRFHAIYWPAMLLSAGEPVPTDIYVHDYLTAQGAKLSKSSGSVVEPFELAADFGVDAVRWWLLAQVPRVGDTDFTREGLVEAANRDLAGGLGNLVQRVTTMVHKYRDGVPPSPGVSTPSADRSGMPRLRVERDAAGDRTGLAGLAVPTESTEAAELADLVGDLPGRIDAALQNFDPRSGCRAIIDAVRRISQYIERTRPWTLARSIDPAGVERLDQVLDVLLRACRIIAEELSPFLPALAQELSVRLEGERLPAPTPAFARVELDERIR